MNIFYWAVFGLVVGLAAYYLDPKVSRGGLIGSAILGILGALTGGLLGDLLFGPELSMDFGGFNVASFIIAAIGSLVLLFINRAFFRKA